MNAQALWAGGLVAALVVALVAMAGVLLFRGVLDVPVLAPEGEGAWGDASTLWLMVVAAGATLLATGLAHVLLLTTPRPMTFLGWVVALATVIGVLGPFTTDAETDSKIATAMIYGAVGIAVGSLVSSVARIAARPRVADDRGSL